MWLLLGAFLATGGLAAYTYYCHQRAERSIHRTHGARIRLLLPIRLFNLLEMLFRSVTGQYTLYFKPKQFIEESHYARELEVIQQTGPQTLTTDQIADAQRKGLQLYCDAMNEPNLWWTGIGRIALFMSHRREFSSRYEIKFK